MASVKSFTGDLNEKKYICFYDESNFTSEENIIIDDFLRIYTYEIKYRNYFFHLQRKYPTINFIKIKDLICLNMEENIEKILDKSASYYEEYYKLIMETIEKMKKFKYLYKEMYEIAKKYDILEGNRIESFSEII